MTAKLSVIVPVYNANKYLAGCLDSLLAQTLKDIDIIWKDLKKAFEEGHIITCCSKFDNEIEKFGLISGHTFTVTNLVEGYVIADTCLVVSIILSG